MEPRVSVGAVLLDTRGKVCIVEQPNKVWSLPKGHIEDGEAWLDALRREVEEEAGIEEFEFVKDLGSYERWKIGLDGKDDRSERKEIHLFLCTTTQETLSPKDPHHPSAKWVWKHEAAEALTHPKDKEFFASILEELP